MWHDARALNRMADLLLAIALLIALYAALQAVIRLPVFDLREVHLVNRPVHLGADDVVRAARNAVNGNFFTLRLAGARAAFEELEWVRTADLRRHWPDRIEVTLVEHVPLARWGSSALVNIHGEVFEARHEGSLPVFVGPDGTAKEIAIQYEHFRRSLAALRFNLQQIEVTERRAWRIRLTGGLTLELGREQIEARLARFIAAYQHTLEGIGHRIDHVDLRYANGFAARIPDLGKAPRRPDGGKGTAKPGMERT